MLHMHSPRFAGKMVLSVETCIWDSVGPAVSPIGRDWLALHLHRNVQFMYIIKDHTHNPTLFVLYNIASELACIGKKACGAPGQS